MPLVFLIIFIVFLAIFLTFLAEGWTLLVISSLLALMISVIHRIFNETKKASKTKYDNFTHYDSDAQDKGHIGESIVAESSEKLGDSYHNLQNVVIKMGNGTTQIDQIIVSQFGIFVLEIKNYDGWIFGTEKQEKWTQRFKTGHQFRFQNPLIQNQRHIQALCSLLKLDKTQFISVIVFIKGDGRIKTSLPANVTTERNFLDYIQSHQIIVFTDIEVFEIVKKISDNRLSDADHQRYMDSLKDCKT